MAEMLWVLRSISGHVPAWLGSFSSMHFEGDVSNFECPIQYPIHGTERHLAHGGNAVGDMVAVRDGEKVRKHLHVGQYLMIRDCREIFHLA